MFSGHRSMSSPQLYLLILLLITARASDLQSDHAALLTFRAGFSALHIRWYVNTSSPCFWKGVTCNSGRITALRLPAASLIGQIPTGSIGNLTALHTLSLRRNALSGPLPADIAGASQLQHLFLHFNQLSGEIPRSLASLQWLTNVNLASNRFSGEIPQDFNNLTRLKALQLQRNELSGQIPDLNLPNLHLLNLSYNHFTGPIPANLSKWPSTAFLGMSLCGTPLPGCHHRLDGKIFGFAISLVIIAAILAADALFSRRGEPVRISVDSVMPPNAPDYFRYATWDNLVFLDGRMWSFNVPDLATAYAPASESRMLLVGKGTYGSTYKVDMAMSWAIKEFNDFALPEAEFRRRVAHIGNVSHPNVMTPRGYFCYGNQVRYLIYDYMPDGSLSELLHVRPRQGYLGWQRRYHIALAAAKGICHIHMMGPRFIHGNIRSSNILLGRPYHACVSEHGLFHLKYGYTHIDGYGAPERRFSQKADVYSFGVVLLELLSGRAPRDAIPGQVGVDLPHWVQRHIDSARRHDVFEEELLDYNHAEEQYVILLNIARRCVHESHAQRPRMLEVVAQIERISDMGNVV